MIFRCRTINKIQNNILKKEVFNQNNFKFLHNAIQYDNIEKRFFKNSLNLSDINSGGSGIFSKDLTENIFNVPTGNNFQNILLMNQGVDYYHLS